ncbi:DUF7793 family protein [Kaarinaea lacus]
MNDIKKRGTCGIGNLVKSEDNIMTLTITCIGDEISVEQMVEAVKLIDAIAERPSPLLVDASLPHSVSFDALFEMSNAKNVKAVAIVAPNRSSHTSATFIEDFQTNIGKPLYPFKVFSNSTSAERWLKSLE